jgi:HAD superfamily hydrolase (TIGR01509 family)
MKIDAIIFDMNGIIIDDELIHEEAFKEICKRHNIKITTKDYQKFCLGRTDEDGFKDTLKKYKNFNFEIKDLVKEKSKKYLEIIPNKIKSRFGVIELINKLSKKYRMALTSSSNYREIDMVLNHFKIKELFEVIVSAEDVKIGKPNPEPYIITAKKLLINPSNCLVFEDSKNGVESAKAAGMYCIGIHNLSVYKKIGIKQNLEKANLEINSIKDIPKNLFSL